MSREPEITAPKDPAAYRPRSLMGPSFWAMMAFAVLCVLAGVAIARLGPELLSRRPQPQPAGAALSPAEAAAPPALAATPAVLAPAPVEPLPAADLQRLDARVAALESHEARTSQAAAAALAAAAVVEASQGSRPFPEELAVLRAVSPPSPELAALARLAETGAPSRAALAASFPDYAAHAASAARAPGDGAGLGDRIAYALSRVVTLRRVGDVPGDSADAKLARAEQLVQDGDLDHALRALDQLPSGAREAIGPWRARADRRAEIDRNAAALRARALQALQATGRPAA
jgi:hypothetical protein